jgi:predicted PurR-regulated permease PerM
MTPAQPDAGPGRSATVPDDADAVAQTLPGGDGATADERRAGWAGDRRTPSPKPLPGPPPGTPERRARHVGWRSRDVIRAAALVFGVWVLGRLLWFTSSLVFVVFLGTLFGLAVGAAVDRLERFRIRRGIASALVVFGTLGALVGAGALMAPTLSEQFGVLRRQIPAAVDRAEGWINKNQGGLMGSALRGMTGGGAASTDTARAGRPAVPPGDTAAARTAQVAADAAARAASQTAAQTGGTQPNASAQPDGGAPSATDNLKARLGSQLSGAAKYLFPFLSSTLAVIGGLVLIIFLAIYIGAEPKLYHDGLMHLFPHRARKRTGEVLTEIATVLRKWLVVQLIAMVVIGTVTTVAMLLLNVKAAFALGFIAGLLEFIPTVGPILSAVPAIAMGFVDGPEKAAAVVLAYWGIQFLENNLLIPWLMRGGMDIPPALTLIAQALMTLVFGFLGLMVAVPLTAAVLVPIKMLYVRDVVGDDVPLMSSGEEEEDDDDD